MTAHRGRCQLPGPSRGAHRQGNVSVMQVTSWLAFIGKMQLRQVTRSERNHKVQGSQGGQDHRHQTGQLAGPVQTPCAEMSPLPCGQRPFRSDANLDSRVGIASDQGPIWETHRTTPSNVRMKMQKPPGSWSGGPCEQSRGQSQRRAQVLGR